MLSNPVYAGAYAYGKRTEQFVDLEWVGFAGFPALGRCRGRAQPGATVTLDSDAVPIG